VEEQGGGRRKEEGGRREEEGGRREGVGLPCSSTLAPNIKDLTNSRERGGEERGEGSRMRKEGGGRGGRRGEKGEGGGPTLFAKNKTLTATSFLSSTLAPYIKDLTNSKSSAVMEERGISGIPSENIPDMDMCSKKLSKKPLLAAKKIWGG
jgi:hypothetical protein